MKLINLFEATNLTPADVWHAQKNNLIVDVQHDGSIYVITDIQPISKEQFRKLYKVSFEPGSYADWVEVKSVDPVKHWGNTTASFNRPSHITLFDWFQGGWDRWHEWLDHSFKHDRIKIKATTWKELVAHLKDKFPPGDDFD